MAVFEYRGILVGTGKQVNGVRDADNAKVLRAALRKDGILLTVATEEQGRRGEGQARHQALRVLRPAVDVGDVAMMTRQLATLVGAGIPLVESLGALIEQVEKSSSSACSPRCASRSDEGISFAKALEPHPHGLPAALREHGRAPARRRARSSRCSSGSPTSWSRRPSSAARSPRRSPTRS